MDRSFLTDNPKLVDEIVCEVKSQGVFDQFRRNCIADVDTKPAYQNLRQRVENIVSNFLSDQVWRPDLNKNQLREKLRKHITEAGFLETGVERIVDQVVNPKINSVFLPKIEDISYNYLGIEKPKPSNFDQTPFKSEPLASEDTKPPINLPTVFDDLEAVSPDSTGSKKSFKDSTENLDTPIDPDSIKAELNDSGDKVDDDFESPAFEPLNGSSLNESDSINGEEDSKLSDISGLTSQDSVNSEQNCEQPTVIPEPEIKAPTIEVIEQPAVTQSQQVIPENINQDSVLSQVSSNSHLSIVTDSNNKSSEVDICEEAQMPKFSENSFNNPVVDDSERKPLMTIFDIKQDEIKFEGTERRSSLHDLNDDIKVEEDIVIEELKEPVPPADSVGDESLMKTESSSSCIDPIITETKDLSLKDDGRSNEIEFKFEEPVVSADTTDASVPVSSSQIANDRHKSKDLKGERKSDSRSDHKSYRRDKDKSSHHSRDRHKDVKHSSSSSSKHSSSSSSSRKDHRSESRETKKMTSSDHRRDESSKSTDRSRGKSQPSSSHSSSRDKDSTHKSSRSHDDRDKNRSRHDRSSSSSKSRSHHRDDKKRQSHDDDENDKRKPGQESETKSKADDDHAVHHEKSFDRRRSTDRDSDDGTMEHGKPTSTNRPAASVNSAAITNSASSSSFSSTASSCMDEYEKRGTSRIQQIAADSNVHTSSTDSDDSFVPTSTPVVVDQILIGSEINLEMLMETNSGETTDETNPIMSMMQQSLSDDAEMKIKKPKVASNIFEVRKLMKVRKQMERDKKKRLEKLLVQSKQMVGCNNVDEQGVELEFSVMNSSAPSISSPIKTKEVAFEGDQIPAPLSEKRNSGEFIIDMNEMKEIEKQMKKKKTEKQSPAPKSFDEILSQIDKPRKRDSKGSQSPTSPGYEKSPKSLTGLQERPRPSEPMARKYVREQSKEPPVIDNKKPATITSPPRQQRDEKKMEKPTPVRSQDGGSKSRKDSSASSKSPSIPQSPTKMEQKMRKPNRIPEKTTKSSSAAGSASSSKHEKVLTPTKPKEMKINITPKTALSPENIPKVRADTSTKFNIDSVEENEPEFFGFSESLCVAQLDYAKVKQTLSSNAKKRTLHLLNYDKSMSDVFSQYSTNVIVITGSVENCVTNEKLSEPDKSGDVAGSQTKGVRKSTTSRNGVRTTPQSQHKLFIENNQFADTADVNKQISRKRRTSSLAQGSAAKIVRLVDSKVSGDETETSPTPSEQSKENQVVQQIKKNNRTADISCTSNEMDQQSGEKSEPTKPNANQRYASDDLYKPRPILSRSRRRCIENGET